MGVNGIKGPLVRVAGKNISKISKVVIESINPLEVIREYVEYKKEHDKQITERNKILAHRDVAIAAIEAEKEVLLKYFHLRFKERSQVIDKLFKTLDNGVKNQNDSLIDKSLQGIVDIVKDNPLKDFETFRLARNQGKEIEI